VQGDATIAALNYGDGRRCTGALKRLFCGTRRQSSRPRSGDSTISARSAAKSDPLSAGAVRVYQATTRPNPSFCDADGLDVQRDDSLRSLGSVSSAGQPPCLARRL
jgi:hypothetical protein